MGSLTFILIVAVYIIILIAAGIQLTTAANKLNPAGNKRLEIAFAYLSWGIYAIWIIVALSIAMLIVVMVNYRDEYAATGKWTDNDSKSNSRSTDYEDVERAALNTVKIEESRREGFLGINEIFSLSGFAGTFAKITLITTLIFTTIVGVIVAMASSYISSSTDVTAQNAAPSATSAAVLSLTPPILLLLWIIINAIIIGGRKKKLDIAYDELQRELDSHSNIKDKINMNRPPAGSDEIEATSSKYTEAMMILNRIRYNKIVESDNE